MGRDARTRRWVLALAAATIAACGVGLTFVVTGSTSPLLPTAGVLLALGGAVHLRTDRRAS